MKKKILFGLGVMAFAALFTLNVSLTKNNNFVECLLSTSISEAAAENADLCASIWTVSYSGSIGTTTSVTCTCTTGGNYKCPICTWK